LSTRDGTPDPIRVLHVKDDPNCREAIADQLSDHGFVVRSFADAFSLADGLAVSSKADIILLDWDLPAISGIELLVELRQCGVNLPVVFLTGYGFTAQENLAFETGAVDFTDKARGVEILARRLRRLLRAPKLAAAPPSASLEVCGAKRQSAIGLPNSQTPKILARCWSWLRSNGVSSRKRQRNGKRPIGHLRRKRYVRTSAGRPH
jgi:DNA-binding response OmpR family regulator